MTAKDIKDNVMWADGCSKRNGVFTVRQGFFYTHGRTASDLADSIKDFIPEAKIVDLGEVWKNFRGGAPLAKSSHFFVKFTI